MPTNPVPWRKKCQILSEWREDWPPWNTDVAVSGSFGKWFAQSQPQIAVFGQEIHLVTFSFQMSPLHKFISISWGLWWVEYWLHHNFLIIPLKKMGFLFKNYRYFFPCTFSTILNFLIQIYSQKFIFIFIPHWISR